MEIKELRTFVSMPICCTEVSYMGNGFLLASTWTQVYIILEKKRKQLGRFADRALYLLIVLSWAMHQTRYVCMYVCTFWTRTKINLKLIKTKKQSNTQKQKEKRIDWISWLAFNKWQKVDPFNQSYGAELCMCTESEIGRSRRRMFEMWYTSIRILRCTSKKTFSFIDAVFLFFLFGKFWHFCYGQKLIYAKKKYFQLNFLRKENIERRLRVGYETIFDHM